MREKEKEILELGAHGAGAQECPNCTSREKKLIKTVYSSRVDYHVDIYQCKCGLFLLYSCLLEHEFICCERTIEEAVLLAREVIEIQEAEELQKLVE